MKIKIINKENQTFQTDDGIEYPLLENTDITKDELNILLQMSENKTKEILEQIYGETV